MKNFLFVLLATFVILVTLYVMGMFSGGIKGLWYDITKPVFDPINSVVIKNRELVKNKIIPDFDYIDSFPSITKYGIYNTDLCVETNYGWKRPINIFDHLFTCKYISQRYYGLRGDYEKTVRDLIAYISINKDRLSFQTYQTEQLFVQKDWINDTPTINKIITAHNIRHKDDPASNIYDVISFIEGQSENSVNTSSRSKDGYVVQLDFIDWGSTPSNIDSKNIYIQSDTPDLREEYVSEINKKHPYGVVVTITYIYYVK